MTERPEFKNWLTLGNVVQIAAMLVTVAVCYKAIEMQVTSALAMGRDHEIRIRALENEIARSLSTIETRLRAIEQAVKP